MKKRISLSIKKTVVFSFLIVFVYLIGTSYAISNPVQDNKHDQIKDIESKLSSEKTKFEVFDTQEKDLLRQLADLEQEVAEKKQSIKELRGKISISNRSTEKLKHAAANLERLRKDTEIKAAERLVALYKYARKGGYITILANARDLDQFCSRVKYIKSIMKEDREILEKLAHEGQGYKIEIMKINEELAREEAIEIEETRHLKNLDNDLEKMVIHLVKIHKEKEFYETAVNELQLAAQNLRQTILNIGENDTLEITQPSRFIDSKGQLPFPLLGKIIKEEKISESVRPIFERGIFVEGVSDNRVKAVFSGRVVFSGRIKGYGDIVIINHGSRFFTISANLSQRKTEEGDLVGSGDIIGLVGGNGSSEDKKLYFEIRRAGENLDPLKWLKLR